MKLFFLTLLICPFFTFSCDRCAVIEDDINAQIYTLSNKLVDFSDNDLKPIDIVMVTERLHTYVELRCKHFGY